jgi:RHS repeat-associated protein
MARSLLQQTCYNGFSPPCATEEYDTVPNGSTNIISTKDVYTSYNGGPSARTTTTYNSPLYAPIEVDEYDFAATTPTRKTLTTYLSINGVQTTKPISVVTKDGNNNILQQTTYSYDETGAVATSGVPQHNLISGQRGNLTGESRWRNTDGAWLKTTYKNDDTGNRLSAADPNGNPPTEYSYTDSWYSGSSVCSASNTNAFLTKITDPLGYVSEYAYDACMGLIRQKQDPNDLAANRTGTILTYDLMNNLIGTQYPDGGSTTINYGGYAVPLTITTTTLATPNPSIVAETILDGYGRTSRQETTSDPAGTTFIDTKYDSLGRVYSVSNPYRSIGDPTYGLTVYGYDALSRTINQTDPDGTSNKTWSYAGGQVTFTDESGNQWRRTSDALGRLTTVLEPNGASATPSMETDYTYDPLNNILSVLQWGGPHGSSGSRGRSFSYDSLSQLIQSYNPESGWICYGTTGGAAANGSNCTSGYDANGNLLHKSDSRGITVKYTYDALNRMLTKTAPGLSYGFAYDVVSVGTGGAFKAANPIGRIVEASNSVNASEQYSYDPMGRVVNQANCIPSDCSQTGNAFTPQYDLAGNLTQLTYPDGRVIKQTADAAGRLQSINYISYNGQAANYPYLSSATYLPTGAPHTLTFGNGVVSTISENPRLQTTEVTAAGTYSGYSQPFLDKQFCYGPPGPGVCTTMGNGKNNGNLMAVPDILNSNTSQAFSYDTLNRISGFANGSGSMQQTYSIDPFGNLSKPSGTLTNILSFGTNNQIISGNATQDSAGNLVTTNNGVSTTTFAFDAEDRISQVNGGSTATYTYNPEDQRVRKDIAGGWTEYLYFDGQPLAEKHSDGTWSDYIFANGQRIARADNFDWRIHIHGTTNTAGSWAAWSLPISAFTVQSGDKISWRQYQAGGAEGGINIGFSDGTGTGWVAKDQNGQVINSDTIQGGWQIRTVDLSSYAGKTLNSLWVVTDAATPVGAWDNYFNDIAFVKMNGTVTPLYSKDKTASLTYHNGGSISNQSGIVELFPNDALQTIETTTYYQADQIGSARMLTAAGGWPIWADTYYPFGEEASSVSATNHDRFTGKERDTESGLDYFGARYYSSTLGRFMSPDWSDEPDPVPYADLENPQTLNLYSYLRNSPPTDTDGDGHAGCNADGMTSVITFTSRDLAPGYMETNSVQPPCTQPGIVDQISNAANKALDTTQQAVNAFKQWATAPRDMGCMAKFAGVGTAAGYVAGGTIGGIGGGAVGTLVEPGGGTIIGAVAGGAGLAAEGASVGGTAGIATGFVACRTSVGGGGGGGPKKWEITNPADKKVKNGHTYLKDAKTGTWWSKDTAEHGGSAWKVYVEGPKGTLNWIADADEQGNYIVGKWKSSVGTTVKF